MNGHPDSPEAVALELMRMIREAEGERQPQRGRNSAAREDLLSLYADCLAATTGRFRQEAPVVLH